VIIEIRGPSGCGKTTYANMIKGMADNRGDNCVIVDELRDDNNSEGKSSELRRALELPEQTVVILVTEV
jgi:ABC-type glutathione transport system ATPase component